MGGPLIALDSERADFGPYIGGGRGPYTGGSKVVVHLLSWVHLIDLGCGKGVWGAKFDFELGRWDTHTFPL